MDDIHHLSAEQCCQEVSSECIVEDHEKALNGRLRVRKEGGGNLGAISSLNPHGRNNPTASAPPDTACTSLWCLDALHLSDKGIRYSKSDAPLLHKSQHLWEASDTPVVDMETNHINVKVSS